MYSPVSQLFTYTFSSPGRLLWVARLALALTLAVFAVKPSARALLPPPQPDGGYPNQNTAEGEDALFSLTTGGGNTALGWRALARNTTGDFNTATGEGALDKNTSGSANTASGAAALPNNTTGEKNTATGGAALFNNQTGDRNTATGYEALVFNTSGGSNTATGFQALNNNSGSLNTANGAQALRWNTTAFFNTAMGSQALFNNRTGLSNTATGYQALNLNQTGGQNTANGVQALYRATGGGNVALGFQAGVNLTTGSNNIAIGNGGVAGESNTIRIGTVGTQNVTFIAGIRGATVASGVAVIVGSSGRLGTITSSARFKEAIKPMDKASEAILSLQPVTFRYKQELDPEKIPQFGLLAEEVEKINPDLVVRDEDGKVMTVRYEAVNAMLLNEFLKEHRRVEEQRNYFEAKIAQQQKQIEALTAGLQKVTARVEASNSASRVVSDN
jgi:trimeric autotransporter adhesin